MTLLAPFFLLGLLGIALPLWLHRRDDVRPEQRPVASLMLFEEGERASARRRRLSDLWLLALRVGLLAAAALAFAQPIWSVGAGGALGRARRVELIALDTSLSMAHGERWARAREVASARIDALASGTRAQLLDVSAAVRPLTEVTADAGVLRDALQRLSPGASRLSYDATLPELRRIAQALRDEARADAPDVSIHLISDSQLTGVDTRELDAFPGETPVRLHSVAGGDARNVFLEDLRATPGTGQAWSVDATVRAIGTEPTEKTATLRVDGQVVARTPVRLPASGRSVVRFEVPEGPPGESRAVVRLEPPDGLPLDDERAVILVRRPPRKVVVVGTELDDRGVRYCIQALQAADPFGLQAEARRAAELGAALEAGASVVVVVDAELSPGEVDALLRFVRAGGGVLMVLGPTLTPESPAPVRVLALTGHSVGASIRAPVADAVRAADAASGARHPSLGSLDDWRDVQLFRYAAVRPAQEDAVLLTTRDDTPVLLEHALGEGRVWILASSLDGRWNDLPLRPAFLSFLSGSVQHLAERQDPLRSALLDTRLTLRAESIRVIDPGGADVLSLEQTQGGGVVPLARPGVYEIREPGRVRLVAVHLDPRESDVRSVDAERLAAWTAGLERGTPTAGRRPRDAGPGSDTAPEGTPLAGVLLAVLAALVLAESAVANWQLGRSRKGAT